MIKGFIFDLDDTLYDYKSANEYATNSVRDWLFVNKKVEGETFDRLFNESKKIIKYNTENQAASHSRMLYFQKLCELLNWKPTECALELYDVYWNSFLELMKIEDGVIELFDLLKSKNLKIAICTELTAQIQHRKIRRLAIDRYIDVLVTSEEAGSEKQNINIFNLTLKKLMLHSKEVIYIGDSYVKDYLGAQSAGMTAYLYCRDKSKLPKLMTGNENIITSFNGIKDIVQSL